ncbi:MAG: ExbD/TolR family protein [Parasphingopyxis sp.]
MPSLKPFPNAEPMRDINTTPFIDVLLVLLVMFLLALPVMNHKVPLELPVGPVGPGVPPPSHALAIGPSGALSWDGEAVSRAGLVARLERMAADPGLPLLEIMAAPNARYEDVDEILADISRAEVTRLGFVGNAAFADGF